MAEQSTELENHVEFQPNDVPENPVSLLKSMQIDQLLALDQTMEMAAYYQVWFC